MHKNGFTLIELMIVVAIIGIIAMFAVPSYQNAQRKTKIAEGIAALTAAQSQIEKTRLEQRKTYGEITLADAKINDLVKHGSTPIYRLTYQYHQGKQYTLTATAQGTWLKEKDQCKTIELKSSGEITPSDCQK
ncbi:type IV pilin protein [Wohlfahrtiimonas sp. G9077]|uniref:type IV pilin protein n=1 Tax=Wohlfahrtiimonas sp. G9077 TaxID=1980118 RepID=UPI000B99536F|nr:type IV pilin protein [Wohlfahrtiimonas sp. G9077]OYQ73773.1 prepilin-type cleavage/methylation domain-containing protein [Wohlfahrtiimonas sp. G9077]